MKILLYAPDTHMARPLERVLIQSRCTVDICTATSRLEKMLTIDRYVAVIIAYSGPAETLTQLCQQVKPHLFGSMLIVVTNNQSALERARTLQSGVDRYYIQPFYYSELLTEVCAHGYKTGRSGRPTIMSGMFELDVLARTVTFAGVTLNLTKTEFDLMALLLRKSNIVLSRIQIWEEIWGYEQYPMANTIDVHMNRLRRKLPSEASDLIRTVYGVGYRLQVEG